MTVVANPHHALPQGRLSTSSQTVHSKGRVSHIAKCSQSTKGAPRFSSQ